MQPPEPHKWVPTSLNSLLQISAFDWILAGGFALETFVGQAYRPHGDIDIIVKRQDQPKLFEAFDSTRLFVAANHGSLSSMDESAFYDRPIQDVWVLNEDLNSWMLQVMLVDEINGSWVFKRDDKIQLPWEDIYFTQDDMKVLNPEIQLLYKAHNNDEKSLLDYEIVYPLLSEKAKNWLNASK